MVTCYTCHQEIQFDKTIRSQSGKMIPLNPDRSYHTHDKDDPTKPATNKWTINKPPLAPQQQPNLQQPTIQKGQFEQRGGEPSYRQPLDGLINQYHNATVQMFNLVKEQLEEQKQTHIEMYRMIEALVGHAGILNPKPASELAKSQNIVDLDKKIPDDDSYKTEDNIEGVQED